MTTATRTRPGGQVAGAALVTITQRARPPSRVRAAAMVCSMVPVGNPVRHSSSKPLGVKPCASDSR
ncbi:Uncharacterised protein [Bordetella pertussis]|nr:Uncharacterised protein [Bordetella pertussis]